MEFYLTMNDRRYQMTAATSEEKDEFIRELRKVGRFCLEKDTKKNRVFANSEPTSGFVFEN